MKMLEGGKIAKQENEVEFGCLCKRGKSIVKKAGGERLR